MKEYGAWERIPGTFYEDRTAPDGRRWVASQTGWKRVRAFNRWKAGGRCESTVKGARCNAYRSLLMGQVHHIYGRGSGGGKREDRREVKGIQFTLWVCQECHDQEVILPWPPRVSEGSA